MVNIKNLKDLVNSYNFYDLFELYDQIFQSEPNQEKHTFFLPYEHSYNISLDLSVEGEDDLLPPIRFIVFSTLEMISKASSDLPNKLLLNWDSFKSYIDNINEVEQFLQFAEKESGDLKLKEALNEALKNAAKTKAPLRILPDFLLKNKVFLEAYAKEHNLSPKFIDIILADEYSPDLEKKFMEILDIKSLDEYLTYMVDSRDIDQLDLADLAVMKLLSLKQLFIDSPTSELKFNNFQYIKGVPEIDGTHGLSNRAKGAYLEEENSVNVSLLFISDVKDAVITTLHEGEHARQHKLIKDGSIDLNPKVLLYSLDGFIREFFRTIPNVTYDVYYKDNYLSFSSEFDAERMAREQFERLMNPSAEDPFFDFLNGVLYNLEVPPEILEGIEASNTKYRESTTRSLNNTHIDIEDIFTASIKQMLSNGKGITEIRRYISDNYPALNYKYEINKNGVRKYTAQELVQAYNDAENEEEKEKFIAVMKSNIDEHFTRRTEIAENLDDLLLAIEESPDRDKLYASIKTVINPTDPDIPKGPWDRA